MTTFEMLKLDDTKAVRIFNGRAERVRSNELRSVLGALSVMGETMGLQIPTPDELIAQALQFSPNAHITYLSVNRQMGDVVLCMVLSDPEYPVETERDLCSPNGVLAYCYNATCDWCSELGYVGYEKTAGLFESEYIHRVW